MEQLAKGAPEHDEEQANHRLWLEMFVNGDPTPQVFTALLESRHKLGLGQPLPATSPEQRKYWNSCIAHSARKRVRLAEECAEDSNLSPEFSQAYAKMLLLCDFERQVAETALHKMNSVQ